MREPYIINENESIKHQVIGVMEFRASKKQEREYPNCSVDLLEMDKRYVKAMLLDGIEKFIKVTHDEDRRVVEGQIFMPYVQDAKFDELKKEINALKSSNTTYTNLNKSLENKVLYLMLPWWKRLFNKRGK